MYHTRVLQHYRPGRNLSLNHCLQPGRTPFSITKAIRYFCFWWGSDCSCRGTCSCLMTAVCVLTQLYWESLCHTWEFLSTNGHIQGEQASVKMEWHQTTSSQKLAIVGLWVKKLLAPVQQNQENPIVKNALWTILCKIQYLFYKTVYCWIYTKTTYVFNPLYFFICSELLTFDNYSFELFFRPQNCNSIAF